MSIARQIVGYAIKNDSSDIHLEEGSPIAIRVNSDIQMIDKILEKNDMDKLLNELLVTMQKGSLCALCGAIPLPIQNILKYFTNEFKTDINQEA